MNIFIEAGLEKGGVLVHCAGGRSRSVAFVVAFIMSTQGCGYDLAYAQVRRARPVASVNKGFEQQLRAYGAAQCDVFAAHQMMLRIRAAMLLERRNLLLLGKSGVGSDGDGAGGGGEQAKMPPPVRSPQNQVASATTTGIPPTPTPRSPRGRGRSPTAPSAGSPATAYWQRRGGGAGGNGGGAVAAGSGTAAASVAAAAAAAVGSIGKGREDQTVFLPKEVGMHQRAQG